jgi:(2R)-3-sulfolactate dehydrogenase (NADP+)
MTVEEIEGLAAQALERAGTQAAAAASVARALARAEAEGVPVCGLFYLPLFCDHLKLGKLRGEAQPRVLLKRGASLLVDAGQGFAHPAFDLALPLLIEAARAHGVAAVGIRHSYNALALGHPAESLAEAGLIGLACANSPAAVAPPGSRLKLFGTNPLAFAVPVPGGDPLAVDQSSSAVTKTEMRRRLQAGQTMPEGWAQDSEGRPTTDPAAGLAGAMLPAGGQKGANIALLVEILAAALPAATLSPLAGAIGTNEGGPPDLGQFLLALDPAAFGGAETLQRIAALVESYGEAGLRLPGARRQAARRRAAVEGVELDEATAAMLRRLAGG